MLCVICYLSDSIKLIFLLLLSLLDLSFYFVLLWIIHRRIKSMSMSIVTGDEGKVPTDAIPQGMHTLSR